MLFTKEFLDLQIYFAKKASAVLKIPLCESLFLYTSLPIRFGVPFYDLRETNTIWQEFLAIFIADANPSVEDLAFAFHQKKMTNQPPMRPQFGCFSYDSLDTEKGVRIHFANNDNPEPGVLSRERISQRQAELKEMFTEIKHQHPDFTFVVSSSWLYNIEAFKRLFPHEFVSSPEPKKNDYHSLGLWGQFINKYGRVKNDLVRDFRNKVERSTSISDLENAFPLGDLKVKSDISYFYTLYKVQ